VGRKTETLLYGGMVETPGFCSSDEYILSLFLYLKQVEIVPSPGKDLLKTLYLMVAASLIH